MIILFIAWVLAASPDVRATWITPGAASITWPQTAYGNACVSVQAADGSARSLGCARSPIRDTAARTGDTYQVFASQRYLGEATLGPPPRLWLPIVGSHR